jgi:integrase
LAGLPRLSPFVIPGDDFSKPRPDLKRPWAAVTKYADLVGVRLHDLRHTYASYGAAGGHAHASTTARYAHLDSDPLRHASETIAGRIAAALEGKQAALIVPLRKSTTV